MRRGEVLYKNHIAGTITETDDGEYVFQYNEKYVKEHPGEFITFPCRLEMNSIVKTGCFRFLTDSFLKVGCLKLLLPIEK